MRVTIFGSGYVGLVTGACLAEAGNHVVCVDVDAKKIERLNKGDVPIHEPGLEALIKRNSEAGRIEFTTDAVKAIAHGLFQIIAVGTPPDEDGSADLRYVLAAMTQMGQNAACAQLHNTETRCARWLLLAHDDVEGDSFPLTQDYLAMMLGVTRPSVSTISRLSPLHAA